MRRARQQYPVLWDAGAAAATLAVAIGVFFLIGPDSAFASVGFDNARRWLPTRIAGLLFLAKGALAWWTLLRCSREMGLYVATVGAGLYVYYAVVFVLTAFDNQGIGTFGAILVTYIAASHLVLARAYLRSLDT